MTSKRLASGRFEQASDITMQEHAEIMLPKSYTWPAESCARVESIMELMASGCWVTGKTGKAIAKQCDVSISTLENYAAEASRHLKLLGDTEHMRTRIMRRLDTVAARGDDKSVIMACKVMLDALGHLGSDGGKGAKTKAARDDVIEELKARFANPTPMVLEALKATGWARVEGEGIEVE